MSGGGGSSNTTTSTKVELPAWYEGYAKQIAGQAYNTSQLPYTQYSGERIAPLESQQTQGLGLVSSLGASNPTTAAANTLAQDTLSGKYLDPGTNPAWLQGSQDIGAQYRDIISPERNALFSKAGAFGIDNSAYNDYMGQQQRQLGDSLSGLWGNIYNQERGQQNTVLGLTPSLNDTTYSDYRNLIGAGDALRSFNQDQLNLDYQNWLDQQNYPWAQYQNFASIAPGLIGNSGGTTTTGPNPYQSSPVAGAVGGGLAGAGLATAVGATGYGLPIAALIGAIAGGALS